MKERLAELQNAQKAARQTHRPRARVGVPTTVEEAQGASLVSGKATRRGAARPPRVGSDPLGLNSSEPGARRHAGFFCCGWRPPDAEPRTPAGAARGSLADSRPSPPPRRIVALAPNLTEIVFALGAGGRLVGVSERSDYPAAAAALPVVGGLTPDLEEKAAPLRPDPAPATTEEILRATVEILGLLGNRRARDAALGPLGRHRFDPRHRRSPRRADPRGSGSP